MDQGQTCVSIMDRTAVDEHNTHVKHIKTKFELL